MKMFEEELERVGAIRPSSIVGGEKIAKLYGFIANVSPFEFGMKRWVEIMTERKGVEGPRKHVEDHAATLGSSLAGWGF